MIDAQELQNRSIEAGELYEVLVDRARDIFSRGKTLPLVIIDLDETLLDKRPRVMKILADLIMDQDPEIPLTDDVRTCVAKIKPRAMKPDLRETLKDVGVEDEGMVQWLLTEYEKKAALDQYIMFDLPNPGSVDFIKGLSTAGAMILYLAGERNKNKSQFGTERSLSMYELPAPRGEVGALFMNDKDELNDLRFKQGLLKPISEAGEVIAVFDNEPAACNLFKRAFPDASVTMIDSSRTSDDELVDGISVMKNFMR